MDTRSFVRAYAKSPLGIASLLVACGAGVAALLSGVNPAWCVLIAVAVFVSIFTAASALGFIPRAVAAEADREAGEKAASRLAEAASAAERLAALRLPEGEVSRARDLVAMEAARFVEACVRAKTYDPEGVQAVVDSLALVDAWLKEVDESSLEKRFDLPDANPFPEAAKRTAEALRVKGALVSVRRAAATGELSGADLLSVDEELR